MKNVKIRAQSSLHGELSFPGDKSLSHRAIIFGSLAEGESHFTNVLAGEDCVCTREAFEKMGVQIRFSQDGTDVRIQGSGLNGLKRPACELYLGNSGTSMRLLMGLLAGQPFDTTLTGDPSLSARPMKRVADPLREMGAVIEGRDNGNYAPITVRGQKLKGRTLELKISSAQVKSAVLLAGLNAEGVTTVTEPEKSRDHTERFLKYFGAKIAENGNAVSIQSGQKLKARDFSIAGDISSAAFFMAIAALVPGSALDFRDVLDNPTRTGIIEVLKRMGLNFILRQGAKAGGPEEVSNFSLAAADLEAFTIERAQLPSLIDEIPILCVLATQARGKSVIKDADELRVKETDRIESMVSQLKKMGANIYAEGNSIIIDGPTKLHGATVGSFKDHRTAMSLIVAGMIAEGETVVQDVECINTSFPTFFNLLDRIGARYQRF